MQMYYVAMVLPPHLDARIQEYKLYMHNRYGCTVGLKSPAHITIVPPFRMQTEKEQQLLDDTAALTNRDPFTLRTDDFSAFRPRTIFIALQTNSELNAVKSSADAIFHLPGRYPLRPDTRPFHPHITIATRELDRQIFAEAWSYFEPMSFREEWIADSISVLRHNQKKWDVIHTSHFQKV